MSKILLLTDCYLPHAGGSRVYYDNLYTRLADSGHDRVTVLTTKVPGWRQFDARSTHPNLKVVRRRTPLPDLHLRYWIRGLPWLSTTSWHLLTQNVDILHTGDLYPPGAIAWLLRRTASFPFVAYCHGEDFTNTEMRRLQRPARNAIYRRADHVVAACELARQRLLQIGVPEQRITKITPGVDRVRFSPGQKRADLVTRHRLQGKHVLLTVARLTARKGHACVLRALAALLPETPDIVYLIAGVGRERARLEQMAQEMGIADAVRFLGYVDDEEMGDLYRLCDVFVMMNRESDGDSEGFGMVFLEASACGKPVIGGASGGTAESILDGETGYRLDPDADALLALRLRELLLNPHQRDAMGAAGLRYASQNFSWSTRAEQLRQLSTDIVDRRKRGIRDASRSRQECEGACPPLTERGTTR